MFIFLFFCAVRMVSSNYGIIEPALTNHVSWNVPINILVTSPKPSSVELLPNTDKDYIQIGSMLNQAIDGHKLELNPVKECLDSIMYIENGEIKLDKNRLIAGSVSIVIFIVSLIVTNIIACCKNSSLKKEKATYDSC
jgi:hypothetical protein